VGFLVDKMALGAVFSGHFSFPLPIIIPSMLHTLLSSKADTIGHSTPTIKNNNKFWEELIAYFPSYNIGHIENDASNNSSIVVYSLQR
jgi:hypothetical protein